MDEDSDAFEARIRAALIECHRLGYHPSDFEAMLSHSNAVVVASKLVSSGDIQTGLKRLAKLGRLDLSVESIMLEPQFETLFSSKLRESARWRLTSVNVS